MKKYRNSRLMDIEDPSTWGEELSPLITLGGLFKEAYADSLVKLIPNGVKLIESLEKQEKDPG